MHLYGLHMYISVMYVFVFDSVGYSSVVSLLLIIFDSYLTLTIKYYNITYMLSNKQKVRLS